MLLKSKLFKMKNTILIILVLFTITLLSGCDNATNVIHDIISNKVSAKDRLDSANAQASRKYGVNSKLVLVLGQNVIYSGTDMGKTDISIISGISDPNSLGAWIYVYKKSGTDSLAVFTPDPTPGARNCIELTKIFNINTLISLIPDTSAKNIVSGAISLINNSNFNITTQSSALLDSYDALTLGNTSSPVIKFNSSFVPSASYVNGNSFFSADTIGTTRTVNMFLIPALGTLNLPNYITTLLGFPPDLWVVNYKKSAGSLTSNLIVGTTVQSSQIMQIPLLSLTSKAINISSNAVK